MQLELLELVGVFAGGAVVGAAADRLAVIMKKNKLKRSQDTLIRNFGEPSTVTTFTFDEAVDWITQHDNLMQNGHEAAVFKVNNQTLSMVNKKFNIDFGAEKYLVIAILKKQGRSIQKSLLVKYDKLDSKLEHELAPGNGFLVIGD